MLPKRKDVTAIENKTLFRPLSAKGTKEQARSGPGHTSLSGLAESVAIPVWERGSQLEPNVVRQTEKKHQTVQELGVLGFLTISDFDFILLFKSFFYFFNFYFVFLFFAVFI